MSSAEHARPTVAIPYPDFSNHHRAEVAKPPSLSGVAAVERVARVESRADALKGQLLDVDGLRGITPPEPLVEEWLFADSLAWLSGKPGHGKTFVAVDLALSVASGTPWLGHDVARGSVLYVIAEGVAGLSQRVDAWMTAHDERPYDVAFLPRAVQLFSSAGPSGVPSPESLEAETFIELVGQECPSLIILDTQARVSIGADENSAKDMGALVATLDRLRQATRACVLVVHHEPRAGDNLRGSTALEGAATTIVRASKDGPVITIENPKQKDAPEAHAMKVALREAGPSVYLSRDLGTAGDLMTASEAEVLATLDRLGEESSTTRVIEASGLPRTTVYRGLASLDERGLVNKLVSGRNTSWSRVVKTHE